MAAAAPEATSGKMTERVSETVPEKVPERVPETIHATCIAVGDRAALLRGRSGSGKSDLALRCLAVGVTPLTPRPARLIADDRVVLSRDGPRLMATPPAAVTGLIEVRGVGILSVPQGPPAEVVLIVDLESGATADRLPDVLPRDQWLGVDIPRLAIDPFHVAAALKVLIAIDILGVAALP